MVDGHKRQNCLFGVLTVLIEIHNLTPFAKLRGDNLSFFGVPTKTICLILDSPITYFVCFWSHRERQIVFFWSVQRSAKTQICVNSGCQRHTICLFLMFKKDKLSIVQRLKKTNCLFGDRSKTTNCLFGSSPKSKFVFGM